MVNMIDRLLSVENTALVGGYHVLDVDECVFSTGLLEEFEGFADEVAQVESFALAVLYLVAYVGVVIPENVQDGQNLPIVRHQGLPDHLPRQHQLLDHLQHRSDDLGVPGVQGR